MVSLASWLFFPNQFCNFRGHTSWDQLSNSIGNDNRECGHSGRTNQRVEVEIIQMFFLLIYVTVITAGGENMEFTLLSSQMWSDHMWLSLPTHWWGIVSGPWAHYDRGWEMQWNHGIWGFGWTSLPWHTHYYYFALFSSRSFIMQFLKCAKEQCNMGNSCLISVIYS